MDITNADAMKIVSTLSLAMSGSVNHGAKAGLFEAVGAAIDDLYEYRTESLTEIDAYILNALRGHVAACEERPSLSYNRFGDTYAALEVLSAALVGHFGVGGQYHVLRYVVGVSADEVKRLLPE